MTAQQKPKAKVHQFPARAPINKARWKQHVVLKKQLDNSRTMLNEARARLQLWERNIELLEDKWQRENDEIEAELLTGAEIEDGGRIT